MFLLEPGFLLTRCLSHCSQCLFACLHLNHDHRVHGVDARFSRVVRVHLLNKPMIYLTEHNAV